MDYLIALLALIYTGSLVATARWAIKEYPTERPRIDHGISFDIFLFFCIFMPIWNTFIMLTFVWQRHEYNKDMKDYLDIKAVLANGCNTEEHS